MRHERPENGGSFRDLFLKFYAAEFLNRGGAFFVCHGREMRTANHDPHLDFAPDIIGFARDDSGDFLLSDLGRGRKMMRAGRSLIHKVAAIAQAPDLFPLSLMS